MENALAAELAAAWVPPKRLVAENRSGVSLETSSVHEKEREIAMVKWRAYCLVGSTVLSWE